jgi:hypothetical protein
LAGLCCGMILGAVVHVATKPDCVCPDLPPSHLSADSYSLRNFTFWKFVPEQWWDCPYWSSPFLAWMGLPVPAQINYGPKSHWDLTKQMTALKRAIDGVLFMRMLKDDLHDPGAWGCWSTGAFFHQLVLNITESASDGSRLAVDLPFKEHETWNGIFQDSKWDSWVRWIRRSWSPMAGRPLIESDKEQYLSQVRSEFSSELGYFYLNGDRVGSSLHNLVYEATILGATRNETDAMNEAAETAINRNEEFVKQIERIRNMTLEQLTAFTLNSSNSDPEFDEMANRDD